MNSRIVILILVISLIVALFTLYLSKPEKKKLALITGLLIFLMSILQIYIVINELGTRHEVELYVFEELTRETDKYLDVLSYAIAQSTKTCGLPAVELYNRTTPASMKCYLFTSPMGPAA